MVQGLQVAVHVQGQVNAKLNLSIVQKWCQQEAYDQNLLPNTLVLYLMDHKCLTEFNIIHKQQLHTSSHEINCKKQEKYANIMATILNISTGKGDR